MDTDRLKQLAPHYAVMFLLVMLVLTVVQSFVGEIELWLRFAIVIVIVFSYRPVSLRLGFAPDAWK
jgi:fatty-acid desaturase